MSDIRDDADGSAPPLPDRFVMVRHPELRRLVAHYLAKTTDGRSIGVGAIDPAHLRRLLSCVFYYDYDETLDDFRLRLAGEEIRAVLPRARRGAWLAEIIPDEALEYIRGCYRRVVRERLVLHSIGRVFFEMGGSGLGERIVVPVSDDEGCVRRIFGATFYAYDGGGSWRARQFAREEVEIHFTTLTDLA